MSQVNWNFACNGFYFDALESEALRINLQPVWEVPALYRKDLDDGPGFPKSRTPLATGATISFRSIDPQKLRDSILHYWKHEEIEGEIDFPYCGTLTLADGWLNIEWNISSVSLGNLKSNLLTAGAFAREPKISVHYNGYVVAGDLGIGAQPETKAKWLDGNATLVMTSSPKVMIVWGEHPVIQNTRGYMEMWELLGT